jgi:pyrroline-5-carboxylate reductase
MIDGSNIVLIGCGQMGSALLKGWLAAKIPARLSVIEPGPIPFTNLAHFTNIESAADQIATANGIVLAVKPQTMPAVGAALRPHIKPHSLILSIAAGFNLERLAAFFDTGQPVIRAMPNTPATIGKAMSVAIANIYVTPAQKTLASQLLRAVGALEWIGDESLLDAVTALSGSGPAYVFLLMDILAKAGVENGLPHELAIALARQTVIGAATLAERTPETSAQTLRENVTSPGGTTEAALEILMNGDLQNLFDRALAAATHRSRDLGKT